MLIISTHSKVNVAVVDLDHVPKQLYRKNKLIGSHHLPFLLQSSVMCSIKNECISNTSYHVAISPLRVTFLLLHDYLDLFVGCLEKIRFIPQIAL